MDAKPGGKVFSALANQRIGSLSLSKLVGMGLNVFRRNIVTNEEPGDRVNSVTHDDTKNVRLKYSSVDVLLSIRNAI